MTMAKSRWIVDEIELIRYLARPSFEIHQTDRATYLDPTPENGRYKIPDELFESLLEKGWISNVTEDENTAYYDTYLISKLGRDNLIKPPSFQVLSYVSAEDKVEITYPKTPEKLVMDYDDFVCLYGIDFEYYRRMKQPHWALYFYGRRIATGADIRFKNHMTKAWRIQKIVEYMCPTQWMPRQTPRIEASA
jgi:hypothetical protein